MTTGTKVFWIRYAARKKEPFLFHDTLAVNKKEKGALPQKVYGQPADVCSAYLFIRV